MGSFGDKIRRNENGYAEKLAQYGINKDPQMKDLADFKDAMYSEFGLDTPQGAGFRDNFNDDEIKALFEQSNVKATIRRNVGDEEADKIYGEVDRGEYEVQKTGKQMIVIIIPKKISVIGYSRNGKPISNYNKSYKRWQTSEIKFIAIRKAKGVQSKQIALAYNKHFKNSQRSMSSINTKTFRI